ncbi:MAG: GTP 3',8-cyclase MoaA [Ignavibacteriales bacterium]|nr:GTP 3',8-cyclase MoaA [Ignavibacteriales bacterium]
MDNSSALLVDSFGRTINNLRISVTDRCNFRCRYCMPEEGVQWLRKSDLLSYEELARLTRIFCELGITKVRLTGGEPLMRKELHVFVDYISKLEGLQDIALTTNGYFLAEQAAALAGAGLRRINVSLDSLDPLRFTLVTRRNHFQRVWEGIEEAERQGIGPIKLNAVLIRGVNDDEIPAFADLARSRPFIIRFIEFMPIGADDGWSPDRVVSSGEVIERIQRHTGLRLVPVELHGLQPADRYRFEDGVGEIGFISSVSEPFCEHCNRVRITADGELRTCLFSLHETDLRGPLRAGAGDDEVKTLIQDAIQKKEAGHLINQPDFVRPERTMSQIGG